MGRIEKIVVLTVVFLIAAILAVSLNESNDLDRTGSPVPGNSPEFGLEDTNSASNGAAKDDSTVKKGAPAWVNDGLAKKDPLNQGGSKGQPTNPGVNAPAGSSGNGPRQTPQASNAGSRVAAAPGRPSGAKPGAQLGTQKGANSNQGRSALANNTSTAAKGNGNGSKGTPNQGNQNSKLVANAEKQAKSGRPVLNSSVKTNSSAPASLLVNTRGLVKTPDEDLMVYTWLANDTFTSVARKYYGDLSQVRLLRTANEGRERDLRAGDKIFVPVRIPEVRTASNLRGQYTVKQDDSLWKIAVDVYGSGARFNEIFEANRDLLETPDSLDVGMILRIPQ